MSKVLIRSSYDCEILEHLEAPFVKPKSHLVHFSGQENSGICPEPRMPRDSQTSLDGGPLLKEFMWKNTGYVSELSSRREWFSLSLSLRYSALIYYYF